MAKPPDKKPAPSTPPPLHVLPMRLLLGDRIVDETGEYEVIGRPYTTAAGKNAHARVKRVGSEVTMIRVWPRARADRGEAISMNETVPKVPLQVTLASWRRLVELVESILDVARPTQTAYLFRGVATDEFGLEPSLLRLLRLASVPAERAHQIERAALLEFQRRAHLHLGPDISLDTRGALAWWSLMQHHGAPTRLLDWTRSPFVAAYFAVEK